jgi:hypothetical protein
MKIQFIILLIIICANILKADWVQVSNGVTQPNINALTASSNYIFAGTNYTFQGGGVFVTTNNGTNWSVSGVYMQTLSLASNENYIYAGTPTGLYRSTNYGINWSLTSQGKWTTAILTNGNYVYAGCFYPTHNTNNGVWVSTNNGINWAVTSLNNVDIYSLTISGNYLFAGGNGIYLSTNNGVNWQLSTSTGTRSLVSNGNYIFAGKDDVFVSTNYGLNWVQTSLNNVAVNALTVYGSNIFAGTGYGVYVTTNNGANWQLRTEGMNAYINSLCISNGYLFAGSDGYGVWRRPLSELVGIETISNIVPEEYKLFQNYPNPFNPATYIKFLIARRSFIKLIIYDGLGRLMEKLVDKELSPAEYGVSFDGTVYPSGVYFYQLIADNKIIETKKLILAK